MDICGNLCYASAEHFRNTIVKYVTNELQHRHKETPEDKTIQQIDSDFLCDNQAIVVLKGDNIKEIDATVAQVSEIRKVIIL